MERNELIKQTKANIRQALSDYSRYTNYSDVMNDVSDYFIERLAESSVDAKQGLRDLFSKSPVWDSNLDALVINGTRTHNPDYKRIKNLAEKILSSVLYDNKYYPSLHKALKLFYIPNLTDDEKSTVIEAINAIAPKAYAPNKKLSRVFKAICTAVGVADETAGSEFQRDYAMFADELTSKKIGFKLYVSINPAHFLTMSNPKGDSRGSMLTSCHSFNSTEYSYNNGCTGYARDNVSFIVFTVSDPKDPETLNNRKTTRQVFAYTPGSGLLLQSRMYNTSGGTTGAQEESVLYRDLVERELSALENMPNLWKVYSSTGEMSNYVNAHEDFGGYADWTYSEFDGHVIFRNDCDRENVQPLVIGRAGLCVACGSITSHGVYCEDCDHEGDERCDDCEEYYYDLNTAYCADGSEVRVCDDCLHENYTYCERCERYVENDSVSYIDGLDVCDDCIDEYYEQCEECDEHHPHESMYEVNNSLGHSCWVCEHCLNESYSCCEECEEYYPNESIVRVYKENGDKAWICERCAEEYIECPDCGETVKVTDDRTCPHCGTVISEEEE